MKKPVLLLVLGMLAAWLGSTDQAEAGKPHRIRNNKHFCNQATPPNWHGGYYHTQWGQPVALVMPPTVAMQTKWRWGVAQTRSELIHYQFGRSYPGHWEGVPGVQYRHTPVWPSHTDQFGVYYVRAPWLAP